MPLRRPTILQDSTLKRATDLAFQSDMDRDISNLSWSNVVDQGISGLKSIVDQASQPAPDRGPFQMQAPDSLPVVVSPDPQIRPVEAPRPEPEPMAFEPRSPEPAQQQPVTRVPATPSGTPQPMPSAAPSPPSAPAATAAPDPSSWEGRSYAAAVKAGHPDPTEFVEQMRWESGGFAEDVIRGERDSTAGARGIAQIMPAVAQSAGVDPLDPDAALTYAASRMAQNYRTYGGDRERALAEYNMGAGNLERYGPRGLPETNKYIDIIGERTRAAGQSKATPAPAEEMPEAQQQAARAIEGIRPTQWDPELSRSEAEAACGLAGAVAFAAARGRYPTVSEAKALAEKRNLWSAGTGMRGAEAEVSLLREMGVAARLEDTVDWTKVRRDVQSGNPVMFDTDAGSAGHYFLVEGARRRADGQWEYNLGSSAADLRASGAPGSKKLWYTEAEIPGLGFGNPYKAIYMDDPTTAQASPTAGRTRVKESNPVLQEIAATVPNAGAAPSPAPAAPWASEGVPPSSEAAPMMLRQPIGPANMGPDTFDTEPYDPRDADQGQREAIPAPINSTSLSSSGVGDDPGMPTLPVQQAPAGGMDDPGTQTSVPAIPPSPYAPGQAASMEPAPNRFKTPSPTVTQQIVAPIAEGLQRSGQAIQRGVEEAVSDEGTYLAQVESGAAGDAIEDWARRLFGMGPRPERERFQPYDPTGGKIEQARRLGYAVVSGALAQDVAEELWQEAGLPMVNVGGMEVAPVVLLLPGVAGGGMKAVGAGAAGPLSAGAQAAAARIPNVAGAIERAPGAALGAAGRVIRSGAEAVTESARGLGSRIGEGLAANAERVAAADARMAAQGSAMAPASFGASVDAAPRPLYSPEPPPGTARRYHGSAAMFDAADPARFDENGLYGPGYYTTSDPRVAGSYATERALPGGGAAFPQVLPKEEVVDLLRGTANRIGISADDAERIISGLPDGPINPRTLYPDIAAASQSPTISKAPVFIQGIWAQAYRTRGAGPNIRAIDLPPDVKLIDMDAPITDDVLERVGGIVDRISDPNAARELQGALRAVADDMARRAAGDGPPLTNDALYAELAAAAERVPGMGKGLVTEILERAGFDGIAHQGGQRVPMLDAAGAPIEHDVSVIFPGSVNKIRNAFSGTYGGATLGVDPGRASGLLDTVSRDVGSSLGTGAFGAAAGAALPAETEEQRMENARIGAAIGLGAGPIARRAMHRAGGALATPGFGPADSPGLGNVPPSKLREPALPGFEPPYVKPDLPDVSPTPNRAPALGDVPSSQINQGNLPGMNPLLQPKPGPVEIPESLNTPGLQRALTNAQRRQEAIERRGLTSPSAWDWLKQAGYAGIYGPATFISSVVGGAQELLLAQPKEAIRALVSGRPGSYAAQVRGQLRAMPESVAGLARVLLGSESGVVAVASGGSQGTANLSERIVNPAGHLAARALERPGEIMTEAPDAVFRPMFTAQGMQREARTIAAERGLRGKQAATYADELIQAAEDLRANPDTPVASEDARRIIEAGSAYADTLGYKGDPGGFGRWLGQLAKRDDPVGVLASFLVPFPSMAARMSTAAARSTPGIGLIPAVRRGQSRFDVAYDQAFGSAVAAGVAYWAFSGGVTGSGPDDPEKRKMMMDQGWQPNSTLVGGYYVPNRVFSRFQPLLDTAGEIHDALAYGKKDRKTSEMVADMVKRGTKIATDQTGLSGLADLNDMLTQGFASQYPGWVTRSALRYLPYSGVIRATANATDASTRRPESWSDVGFGEAVRQNALMAVPGGRQMVPAGQDILGREAKNPQQGLGAFIPRVTTPRNDPTIKAFQDAKVDIGYPPNDLPLEGGVTVPLTPAEQRAWNAERGKLLEQFATRFTSAPWWQNPEARQKGMQTLLSDANAAANAQIKARIGAQELTRRAREAIEKKKAS
jgi:hypothetical protein